MKRKFLAKSVIVALSLAAASLLPTSVLAADSSSIVQALSNIGKYIQNVVNKTAETVAGSLYEFNPNLPNTIKANVAQQKASEVRSIRALGLAVCQVYNTLPKFDTATPVPDALKSLNTGGTYRNLNELCSRHPLLAGSYKTKEEMSNIPATDTLALATQSGGPAKLNSYIPRSVFNASEGNASFNFDSLLIPQLYEEKKTGGQGKNKALEAALNFVTFSSQTQGYDSLLSNDEIRQLKNTSPTLYPAYQIKLRSYIAAQSIGVSNLYQMIADRLPQKDIEKLNLKDKNGRMIQSPLQYRHYLATHRTNDEGWFEMVNTASPATIARETLLVLSEIEQHLYRMERTNERMLATLSAMQLEQLNASERTKLDLLTQQAQTLIQQKSKEKMESSVNNGE